MNILLISQNRERVPYPVLPIGLCGIAEALERSGHDVHLLDLCFARRPDEAVARAIAEHSPQLVGIGIRNMDNCDAYVPKNFLPESRALVERIRGRTHAPVVIGGSAVSVMPAAIAELVRPDFAITGDGELAIVRLADAIARGVDPSSLPGITNVQDGIARTNPPVPVAALDDNPTPRIYRWVDPKPYMRLEGVYPLQSKRGCSLTCTYCTYRNIEGKRYRLKSGEAVADEIEDVVRHSSVRDFEFVDSTFNVPERHALDICDAVIRRRLDVRFIGSGMNPLSVSDALFEKMRAAGFGSLICTAESASDRMLLSMRKGFTRKHVDRLAEASERHGFRTLWVFLVGGPGESRDTVLETLDFIHDGIGRKDVAYVTNGLRIYPNTPLARTALAEGVIASEAELIEPRFYFSSDVERDWLRDTMETHARRDPRLITAERAQSALVPLGLRVLAMTGVRKPFWRFAPLLNRALRFAS